jgi:hypothetical protein
MLVTTVPAALDRGATLVTRARALAFAHRGDRVTALSCAAMDARGVATTARRITIRARAYIAAGGAIGTPALLLRSRVPDPHGTLGQRTFLHPTVVSAAIMPDRIDPCRPQTSTRSLQLAPLRADRFKLEAAPAHPLLMAITLPGEGQVHARWMRELPHLHVAIALLRDGSHRDSPGGTVAIDSDGAPVLDYPLTPYVWRGVREAFRTMAALQFAAGARTVMPIHGDGAAFADVVAARAAIDGFALAPLATPVMSAHVMAAARSIDRAPPLTRRPPPPRNLHVMDGRSSRRRSAPRSLDLRDRRARLRRSPAASLAPARTAGAGGNECLL